MQRYLDLVAEFMVAFTKDWDYREGTPEEEYEW